MTRNNQSIVVFGKPECPDFQRSRAVLEAHDVTFRFRDIVSDPSAELAALQITGESKSPVIVFPDGSHVVEPSDEALRARLTAAGTGSFENDSAAFATTRWVHNPPLSPKPDKETP